jgi:hypothetical protein
MAETNFIGKSRALSQAGLNLAAAATGVDPIDLWTVVSVETSGCGFLPDRRPQVLFERHYFHRLTKGRFDDGDISDASPGGYGLSGTHQYERLNRALALDRTAALQSASWGMGQIMGENHAAAGFPDVEAMVAAMAGSEDSQVAGLGSFCKNAKMVSALKNHDWVCFAEHYNGPAYATNRYDVKLRKAFETGKIPDLRLRAAQLYLMFNGFNTGGVDGQAGPGTRAALGLFCRKQALPPTNEIDDQLLARLEASLG